MPAPIPADWPGIAALAAAGTTLEQLSRQTGISMSALKSRSARGGWKLAAPKAIAAKAQAGIDSKQMKPAATNGIQIAADALADDDKATRTALSRAMRKGAEHLGTLKGAEVVKLARNGHEIIKGSSTLHGWDASRPDVRINVFTDAAKITDAIEIEAEVERVS